MTPARRQRIMGGMLGGFGILLLFLLIGEGVSTLGIGLSGNVIGMLLLTAALALGIVRVDQVRGASDTLLDNLAFLFVPPGIGVMVHFGVIGDSWKAILVALVVSTVAVLVSVGVVSQWLLRRGGRPHYAGEEDR